MGNSFARALILVHPTASYQPMHGLQDVGSVQRIKVRMTEREFKELVSHAETAKDGAGIGRLIVEGCLEGRWEARPAGRGKKGTERRTMFRSLETIAEKLD